MKLLLYIYLRWKINLTKETKTEYKCWKEVYIRTTFMIAKGRGREKLWNKSKTILCGMEATRSCSLLSESERREEGWFDRRLRIPGIISSRSPCLSLAITQANPRDTYPSWHSMHTGREKERETGLARLHHRASEINSSRIKVVKLDLQERQILLKQQRRVSQD